MSRSAVRYAATDFADASANDDESVVESAPLPPVSVYAVVSTRVPAIAARGRTCAEPVLSARDTRVGVETGMRDAIAEGGVGKGKPAGAARAVRESGEARGWGARGGGDGDEDCV